MKIVVTVCAACLLGMSLPSYSQSTEGRLILGRKWAEQELQKVLNEHSNTRRPVAKEFPLPDSAIAIQAAEPILFKLYGRKHIANERPYESYLIDHYWLIAGTLPEGYIGGCFRIVLDARTGQVIGVTHYQ